MEKIISIDRRQYEIVTYRYEYDESEFNDDVKRNKVEGITFKELVDIFDRKVEDKQITFNDFYGKRKSCLATDFFNDCFNESIYNYDPYDSQTESVEDKILILERNDKNE